MVSVPEVWAAVSERHRLDTTHRFAIELGWREYFHHAWRHDGEAIFQSLHPGPLPDAVYRNALPDDVLEARTGVPVIDHAVRDLIQTGWLHNHARLWLASYLVHVRKIHWRVGADWMVGNGLRAREAASPICSMPRMWRALHRVPGTVRGPFSTRAMKRWMRSREHRLARPTHRCAKSGPRTQRACIPNRRSILPGATRTIWRVRGWFIPGRLHQRRLAGGPWACWWPLFIAAGPGANDVGVLCLPRCGS